MPCGNTGCSIGMLGPEVDSPARWFLMSLLLLLGDFSLVVTVYTLWVMVEELETNRVFFWRVTAVNIPIAVYLYNILHAHTHTYIFCRLDLRHNTCICEWIVSSRLLVIYCTFSSLIHYDTLILVLCLISFCNLQFNQSIESILYCTFLSITSPPFSLSRFEQKQTGNLRQSQMAAGFPHSPVAPCNAARRKSMAFRCFWLSWMRSINRNLPPYPPSSSWTFRNSGQGQSSIIRESYDIICNPLQSYLSLSFQPEAALRFIHSHP